MKLNTDGIVLTQTKVGETDTAICVLTRDYGVLRGFVRGARNIKSKNLSATQPLCYSRFSIYKGRDKYIFDEAESIELFFKLRQDIEKLALSQYFCELAKNLAPEDGSAEDFLRLLLNSLHLLSVERYTPLQIKSIYEMRVMSITGYMPDLIACKSCGAFESESMYFDFERSAVYCKDCGNGSGCEKISMSVVSAMRHIVFSQLDKLFAFTLPDGDMMELARICEKYLLLHTQQKYKTLDFYNSLFDNTELTYGK